MLNVKNVIEEIFKIAETEASWLKYYGHKDSRTEEQFNYCLFYDRMYPIGYSKVYTPLKDRCPMGYVDALNIESDINICYGPRNHSKSVYTCLEFVIHNKIEGYLELIKKIHNKEDINLELLTNPDLVLIKYLRYDKDLDGRDSTIQSCTPGHYYLALKLKTSTDKYYYKLITRNNFDKINNGYIHINACDRITDYQISGFIFINDYIQVNTTNGITENLLGFNKNALLNTKNIDTTLFLYKNINFEVFTNSHTNTGRTIFNEYEKICTTSQKLYTPSIKFPISEKLYNDYLNSQKQKKIW